MDEERLNEFLEDHGIKGRQFFKKAKKWSKKSTSYSRYVNRVHQKIFDNDQLIKSYLNTIRAMNSGQIKRGESFVENFLMIYKSSLDDKD